MLHWYAHGSVFNVSLLSRYVVNIFYSCSYKKCLKLLSKTVADSIPVDCYRKARVISEEKIPVFCVFCIHIKYM